MIRLIALLCVLTGAAHAHQLHPAHLTIKEGETLQVTWRAPRVDGALVPLEIIWPEGCAPTGPPEEVERAPSFERRRWFMRCAKGLRGALRIEGARESETDTFTRILWADGRATEVVLGWRAPQLKLEGRGVERGALSYLPVGIEHILLGPDHLAFVFGLFLLVGARLRALGWTTLAFTLGHSITLASAALGLLALPPAPVEATIALSILILARALLRPDSEGFSQRNPWLFALACGLLHGFGFAGALAEIGLPLEDTTLSLLMFNLGVEVGQLIFIAAAWIIADVITAPALRRWGRLGLIYATGGLAAYWLIERVTPLLAAALA